jgi:hypothetical protein
MNASARTTDGASWLQPGGRSPVAIEVGDFAGGVDADDVDPDSQLGGNLDRCAPPWVAVTGRQQGER